jgi:hypothetical protein
MTLVSQPVRHIVLSQVLSVEEEAEFDDLYPMTADICIGNDHLLYVMSLDGALSLPLGDWVCYERVVMHQGKDVWSDEPEVSLSDCIPRNVTVSEFLTYPVTEWSWV